MTEARSPLACARFYARHEWPVFPLKPNDKIPLGKLAPHGCLDATTDLEQIDTWWTAEPTAGIGLRTGRASGTVVIDVDPRHGGDVSLKALQTAHSPLPETVEAQTGGGGQHLVFAYPANGTEIRNCTRLCGMDGLDVRGEGGYIAVDPTIHPSGKPYRWREGRGPQERQPAELPDWLLVLLVTKPGGAEAAPRGPLDTRKILAGIPEGQRDEYLWGFACKLRGADVPIEAAFEMLATAASNATPPFELQRAYDKVKRAYARYEPGVRIIRPEPQGRPALLPATATEVMQAAALPILWAVHPILQVKTIAILSGAGKTMKTTTALGLAITAIQGGSLAGVMDSEGHHTVAWFDFESTLASWSRKYLAVCRGLGTDAATFLKDKRMSYFQVGGLYLDQPDTLKQVIAAAKTLDPSIIVFDSLTRMHHQKENDAAAMSGLFTSSIFRIRDEVNCGIVILHHNRKSTPGFRDDPSDAMRGTVDLRNVVDTHLSISRSRKDGSLFKLSTTGQRDAQEAEPFTFRSEWTEAGITFLPADSHDFEEPGTAGRPPTIYEAACTIIRDALVSDASLTFGRAVSLCEASGISSATSKRAWRGVKNE
jgi:bifunctional DNA primase/polymerase-like protein/AAA domain-containing protein